MRDFAQVQGDGKITKPSALKGLERLRVDSEGLDELDLRVIKYLMDHCGGGPAGVQSVAVGVSEDAETIEEICEPYLIQQGFLRRTSAGRILTEKAYKHFSKELPAKLKSLF